MIFQSSWPGWIESIQSYDTKNENEDEHLEINRVQQITQDDWEKNDGTTAVKVRMCSVNLGDGRKIHGFKGEVCTSDAHSASKPTPGGLNPAGTNMRDTEVFISDPDIYTQQVKSLFLKFEANPVQKKQKDENKKKSVSVEIDCQRILPKRSAKLLKLIIDENSGAEDSESEWEPIGSENEDGSNGAENLDQGCPGTNKDLHVRQSQVKPARPRYPIMALTSDKVHWRPRPKIKRAHKSRAKPKAVQTKSRAKPIVIRKPIFEEDSGESQQQKEKSKGGRSPRKCIKKSKYQGRGRPRKGDNHIKKCQTKQLLIPKHRFVGDERMKLINYAMKHGAGEAAVHFSNTLGVAVCDSTVRAIVKKHLKDTTGKAVELKSVLPSNRSAQNIKYTSTEKQEITKYCLKYGPSQTACHLTRLWGIRVGKGSVVSIVKWYKKSLAEAKARGQEKGLSKEKGPEKGKGPEEEKSPKKEKGPEQEKD